MDVGVAISKYCKRLHLWRAREHQMAVVRYVKARLSFSGNTSDSVSEEEMNVDLGSNFAI